jgi:hypothetical protein
LDDSCVSVSTSILGFIRDPDLDAMSFVNIALDLQAFNVIRAFQYSYAWPSQEKLHWFQALIYKRKGYDPIYWQTHAMDWDRNLTAILKADNPILLSDILIKNPSWTFAQTNDQAFPDIWQFPRLAKWLKDLVESGQTELLLSLVRSKPSVNLHLEDYSIPKSLPETMADFELFWAQGYCYLSTSHLMRKACEHGRDDILEFIYKLGPEPLQPDRWDLILAAENGHLNVLEWALDHNLSLDYTHYEATFAFNRLEKIPKKLQENLLGLHPPFIEHRRYLGNSLRAPQKGEASIADK